MALAPVAPEGGGAIGAALLFIGSAVVFLTWLIIYMLRFGAGVLLRGLIAALATFLPSWFGIRHSVESGVAYVAQEVDDALASAANASQGVAVAMFNDGWKLTRWVGYSIESLAVETAHAVKVLVTTTIPQAVEHPLRTVRNDVARLVASLTHLQATVQKQVAASLVAIRASLARAEAQMRAEVATAEHAITVTLPGTIRGEVADMRGWTSKQIRRLSRRVSRVEAAVGLTALSAVVVGVIAREIPWVRCRNVGKVGKQLCETPVRDLERELAQFSLGLTAILGTISIVSLAEASQAFTHEVERPLAFFVRELRDAKLVPGPSSDAALARFAAGRY